jgi:hypothetical protein
MMRLPAPPTLDLPTAMQLELEGHETALRSTRFGGALCVCHVAPPVVVAMTVLPSIAVQSEAVGHEMPNSASTPEGRGSFVQVSPPSVVVMLTPPYELVFPTAVQSELFGQETAFSSKDPMGTT